MAAPRQSQQTPTADPHGVPLPTISDREAISLLNLTSRTQKMSDFVYTASDDGTCMVVDGAPPGPTGRLFTIPPREVVEVPEEAAKELCNHKAYDGIVRVPVIRSRTGTTFDIEAAHAASVNLLEAQDKIQWARWVNDSVEDFIKRSKPVPPPPPRILSIIKRRGYKPEDFGIVPIGWSKPQSEEAIALKKENTELRERLDRMEQALMERK